MMFERVTVRALIEISSGLLLILLGAWLQTNKFMNTDVSWLMIAAERLLQGGSYTTDFFENNPPFSIYLYITPIMISQLFGLSQINSLILFTSILMVISVLLCRHYLQLLLPKSESALKTIILFTLITSLSLLFIIHYAQREHFTILLIFPYLILMSLRLENKPVDNTVYLSALMAAIGFCIKPYFLLCYFALELLIIWQLKSIRAYLRIENLIIIMVIISYILATVYFSPEYFTDILPYAYYIHSKDRYFQIIPFLLSFESFHLYLILLTIPLLLTQKVIRSFTLVLSVTLFTFIAIFLIQSKGWAYQLLPVNVIGCVLIGQAAYISFCKIKKGYLLYSLACLLLLPQIEYQTKLFQTLFYQKNDVGSYENQLINEVNYLMRNKENESTIYFISPIIYYNTIVSRYSLTKSASRFPDLWLITPQFNPNYYENMNSALLDKNAQQIILQGVTEEIHQYQPELVIIPIGLAFGNKSINDSDLLNLLTTYPPFEHEWQNYKVHTKLTRHTIYKRQNK